MKNDLTCAVVRDLLPSYIEKLTSEETNEAVKRHLGGCEDCRRVLAAMQGGDDPAEEQAAETKEIDYLKKVRTGTWKRVAAGVLAAAVLLGAGFWYKTYRYGSYVDPSAVNITAVTQNENGISISGNLKDKSLGVTHADLLQRTDGTMEIGFRAAKMGGKDNDFHYGVGAEGAAGEAYRNIQEIWLGDRIVWYQGTLIDEQTAEVWNARHAYVGDMPANAALAEALGIRDVIGPYENELSTAEEPYGWTIVLQTDINSQVLAGMRKDMRRFAAVLIACVDNLDWVEYRYTSDGAPQSLRVSAAHATTLRNADIKEEASDPARLQLLMQEWPEPIYYTDPDGN